MEDKAQGAFEYILLLAGILLVVVLVIVLLKGFFGGPINATLEQGLTTYNKSVITSIENASKPLTA